jgi:hypothetical protein
MTEDKQIKNLPEDIVISGLGESLLRCDDESFKDQIEGISQDELKKLLKDDDTSEDIMKDVLQRYIETISIEQKESKISNIDTNVDSSSPVASQHIKYDDEFDRLIHMPDDEFRQEIVSMSDSGFETYMKKSFLSSWQKADIRGRRNELRI